MINETFENDLRDIEDYLCEFAPHRPRALSGGFSETRRTLTLRRLAAAAVLLLAAGVSIEMVSRRTQASNPRISALPELLQRGGLDDARHPASFALTRLALENPEKLGKVLAHSPRAALPRFDRPGSALHILAKE